MSNLSNESMGQKEKKKFVLLIILFCSVLFFNEAIAQNVPVSELTRNKYALQNLKSALSSENCGIKRSAIYLIGKHKIAEGEIILEKMLRTEKDPCSRILITLVLLELNEPKGLVALKELAKSDLKDETKKLATFTFNEYLINDLEFGEENQK
ncbi:MAG: hypothetical protein OQJ93_06110 [Ignavibacteriaceae bacterium]|nr:hypothetical protein [Ignavibacteriaceae bacterium]MCW8817263.1 hypothetical protein [Ignavibacteriaceae bacterium]MCW9096946.1 hypothetical protein [Ignavibacteriaceae bacterium]